MTDFAIINNKNGVQENIPSILIDEAFITSESKNIHDVNGEYQRVKGRVSFFYDADGEKIKTPTAYYAIAAVSTVNKTFSVATDLTAVFTAGKEIRVNGSTGNDKLYTVVSSTYSAPNTVITVTEAIADATADGNIFVGSTPIISFHTHIVNGVKYLFVGTAYHVFLWNDTNRTLTPKFTSGTPASVEQMDMVSHYDGTGGTYNVYMTNNVDKIQVISSMSGNFGNVEGASGIAIDGTLYITKARILYVYETYLFIGYPTYNNASIHSRRVHWSDRGLHTFDTTGSGDTGYKDFVDDPSELVGLAVKGNTLIVAKSERMIRGWLTTQDTVFEWDKNAFSNIGCVSRKTLINDKDGRLYWIASDNTIRELDTPSPLSRYVDKTLNDLNVNMLKYAQATFIDEYACIWFAVTTSDSETNNLIISYNTETGKLFLMDFPIRAFGDYSRQSVLTYDTLPYGTYEEWGISWILYDTNVNTLGYALDLASDYEGGSYSLHSGDNDDGENFEGTLVFSTTLSTPKTPNYMKRLDGADFYFLPKYGLYGADAFITNGDFANGTTGWSGASDGLYLNNEKIAVITQKSFGFITVQSEDSQILQYLATALTDKIVYQLRVVLNIIKDSTAQYYVTFYDSSGIILKEIYLVNGTNEILFTGSSSYASIGIGYKNGDITGSFAIDTVFATIDDISIKEVLSKAKVYLKKHFVDADYTYVGDAYFEGNTGKEAVVSRVQFDKRVRGLNVKLVTTGDMSYVATVFRNFYFDGDR